MCKHKNIIITEKSSYCFPKGWEDFEESEDFGKHDISKYFIRGIEYRVYCEDCDTVLED